MNTPLAMPELQGASPESVGEELLELKPRGSRPACPRPAA